MSSKVQRLDNRGQMTEVRKQRTAEYRSIRKIRHSKFLVRYSIFKTWKIDALPCIPNLTPDRQQSDGSDPEP